MSDFLAWMIRYRVALVVVLGVALFLPSLRTGFVVDDWFQLALAEGAEFMPQRGQLDLFSFLKEGDEVAGSVLQLALPWWASDDFVASFWRPLTSLTHVFDHRLFGRYAPAHHAISLLVWALLLVLVMRFFHTLARDSGRGLGVVLFAGLIYALDDAHVWNVSWLANRNALLSVLISLGGLYLYHLYRRDARLGALFGSLLLYMLGLTAAEATVAFPMWVLAYELTLGEGAISARLRALAPVAVITVAYLFGWSAAGYGVAGSDLYISPFDRPLDFTWFALVERIPMLIMGALSPIPAELVVRGGPEHMILAYRALGWLCAVSGIAVLWPLCRRDPVCRFMGLGALLSLLPMAGTFAHNRLLLFATVGSSWVLACFIVDGLSGRGRGDSFGLGWCFRRGNKRIALIVLIHLVLAPLGALGAGQIFSDLGRGSYEKALAAAIPVGSEAQESQVLVLNSPDPVTPTYLGLMRWAAGYPMSKAAWSVSIVPGDQVMVRTGENSFTLEVGDPGFFSTVFERLVRAHRDSEEGEEFTRGALKVRAVRVVDGKLRMIEVSTDLSLDDPRNVLLAWDGQRWRRMEPPQIGECRLLPLEGYRVGMLLPAHPKMGHRCADEATFFAGSAASGSPSVPQDPVTVAAVGMPPLPSSRGGEPLPVRPCTLELWTGGQWRSRAELECPEDGKLRLLTVGDVGHTGAILDMSLGEMQRACAADSCQLLLLAGDLIYGPGIQAEQTWRGVWDEGLARLQLPTLAVLGNHEYRHEPGPERKREVLYAADGRAGLILPSAHYAVRLKAGDEVLLAIAALDTDSLSLPGPGKPGLGMEALAEACAQGAPVIALGHHPPSSQGRHYTHEAWLQAQLRDVLSKTTTGGCNLVAFTAGHDHDLQAYGPGCEQEGVPAVVVSGVVARGYRGAGSAHLTPCLREGAQSSYHAGPRASGGFAILELDTRLGKAQVSLIDVPQPGRSQQLGTLEWQFPAAKGREDAVRESR